MVDYSKVADLVQKTGATMIDLKYTDLIGRWKHVTIPANLLNENLFTNGIGFDGSSTAGFKRVEKSDTVLIPDPSTAFIDPFWSEPTVGMICDIVDAESKEPFPLDPRQTAKRAEAYLRSTNIATKSLWSPEHEFFIFDGIEFGESATGQWVRILEDESKDGFGAPFQNGYHAPIPIDKHRNLRTEMCVLAAQNGIPIKYHHAENGWPGQQEIETDFEPLLAAADHTMLLRYIVRNVAVRHGKTATFLPKPMVLECGSGMHVHQKLVNEDTYLFFDASGYAGLSQIALYYIGGLLKHADALTGFVCASLNSYHRLVEGFEAPTLKAFALSNRTAAIRIPGYANTPETKRFEFRPPDATGNIYFTLAAQLMAGLDGIINKIDPTREGFGPYDVNVFELSQEEKQRIGFLPTSFSAALEALEADHEFLLRGGVFTEEIIKNWISFKKKAEILPVSLKPHPYEFRLYYDL